MKGTRVGRGKPRVEESKSLFGLNAAEKEVTFGQKLKLRSDQGHRGKVENCGRSSRIVGGGGHYHRYIWGKKRI